ncbi:alcohol dehydrogenase catalytic domain-containing protein [Xenorhabdus bovienii]|uniref:zinc-dependent alcohol dehydrogenase n=1 Tax=Xenorhabdus bovienii TaxID=40576 RepID=UPI0023B3578F|nr:alcohol dehydrogenase catalytic domain-containing protein [Xenorhabdus bovienii]MDE9519311.1 alcohol dehydrogenase catalytic domain-containing protein [Xenorhabdus bovienii]
MFYSLMCHGKRNQAYEPEVIPQMPPGFLQVEIVKAAICGSDHMVLNQTHPYKQYPAILGHEFIGRVTNAAGISAFHEGQWVTGLSYGACGSCPNCKRELSNHCLNKVTYNTAGSSGAFTRTMTVHHSSVLPLPQNRAAEDNEYVLSEPLSIVVHALNNMNVSPNARLTIIGAGAMGLLSAIFCREEKDISEVTLIDKTPSRCEFARSLGFRAETDMSDIADSDVDILVIAGGEALNIDNYIALLRPGAQVVLISYFDTHVNIDMNMLVRKEITLRGSFLSDRRDLAKAIQIIQQSTTTKDSALKKIITDVITFAELRDFMLNKTSKGKVLINEPGVLS